MDNQFSLFGIRFGIDSFIGIIPGIGDIISLVLGSYLVWIAIMIRLPILKILLMIYYLFIDFAIGTIPFIGDISDIFYKANIKNLKILESYFPHEDENEVYSSDTKTG